MRLELIITHYHSLCIHWFVHQTGAATARAASTPCYHLFQRTLRRFRRLIDTMHVEFLAVPRRLAGTSQVEVPAHTLGQLLTTLAAQFPLLGEFITLDQLHPSFIASLNGEQFVSDPQTVLGENDHVLILSADAGG